MDRFRLRGEHAVILRGRSSTVLRSAIIVAVAVAVPALAGCEAGTNAPTYQWHPPTPGAHAVLPSGASGQLAIRNVFVLGAPPDTYLTRGSSAGLFLAISNTGPADRLVSISAPGAAASVRLPRNGVEIRRNKAVYLTGPAPRLVLADITRRLVGGQAVRMILTFRNAGSVTLTVPVMSRAQDYTTFSPAPVIPTATPAKPSASASPGASSAAPSPSATS
jgi:copper(I)-binding protein